MDSQELATFDSREDRTIRLAQSIGQETVVALRYGPDFLDELAGLSQTKRLFDVVVVDCTHSGFFFTADVFVQCASLARNLLEVQGALVFVKNDKAAAVIKESMVGLLSFQLFDTLSEVYDYSPSLARHIQSSLGARADINEKSSDLSEQMLLSCVPVLTSFGIKLKAGMESSRRRNIVLSAIDNYTPLSAISEHLETKLSYEQLLEEIRSLEESGAVFPIFAKIPFLVHCFRNRVPFKLKDYLVEARLITQDQLDNILFAMQNTKGAEQLSIGSMCVSKGLITSRQLEVSLQDQAFYGQGSDTEKEKVHVGAEGSGRIQSLVGHLGTTEPAGILQSLSTNRETGVLSVEHKDMQFRALFEQGKLVKAKQAKLKGNNAIVEFVSCWKEGIFVFIERQAPADLADDTCAVTRPLDKLLLDSALASDNIDMVWKKLPRGPDTPLEKLPDPQNLLSQQELLDPQDNYALSAEEIEVMQRLWKELDGLVPIAGTIKKLGDVTTLQGASAVNRLLLYQLVTVPAMDLSGPLQKFQAIVSAIAQHVGLERSGALLRLSLQASQGYSARARMFSIGTAAEVGVDLALARSAGASLTEAIKELEDWQVKYIEYVSNELDKGLLRDIVYRVHRLS